LLLDMWVKLRKAIEGLIFKYDKKISRLTGTG
jgi:hypothetical protein